MEKEAEKVGLEENQRLGEMGIVRKEWGALPGREEKSRTERGLPPREGSLTERMRGWSDGSIWPGPGPGGPSEFWSEEFHGGQVSTEGF